MEPAEGSGFFMVNYPVPYKKLITAVVPPHKDDLQRYIKWMIIAEYSAALFAFIIGHFQLYITYMVGQLVFFLLYAIYEVVLYKKFRPSEFDEAILQTFFGIRVARLHIPLWFYNYLVFLPNYIHVISTSFTAGSSYVNWYLSASKPSRDQFLQNWEYIPILGPFIGNLGIPSILTVLLVFSCAGHLICAFCLSDYFWGEPLPEVCDAGNLLFLGKAFRSELAASDIQANNQLMRLIICIFIKYPFLWVKTSLLAVQYDFMPQPIFYSTLLSIALGWYGVLQLLPSFVRMADSVSSIRHQFFTVVLLIVMLCGGLAHQAIHLIGVFACKSHDFSIFKGGCGNSTGSA